MPLLSQLSAIRQNLALRGLAKRGATRSLMGNFKACFSNSFRNITDLLNSIVIAGSYSRSGKAWHYVVSQSEALRDRQEVINNHLGSSNQNNHKSDKLIII